MGLRLALHCGENFLLQAHPFGDRFDHEVCFFDGTYQVVAVRQTGSAGGRSIGGDLLASDAFLVGFLDLSDRRSDPLSIDVIENDVETGERQFQ